MEKQSEIGDLERRIHERLEDEKAEKMEKLLKKRGFRILLFSAVAEKRGRIPCAPP